jgi:hypothetical protein
LTVEKLVRYLETGSAPAGLFAQDVFADLTLPHWRVQAADAEGLLALRAGFHPYPGVVRLERVVATDHGFVLEFEERWMDGGQAWYSREMLRAELDGGLVTELSVYCTGDWDEARQRVRLIRN